MKCANFRCGIMPSFLGISQNQGIELIKFVLDTSRIEKLTFFILFPVNSEHLQSPYYMSRTMQM